MIKTPVVRILIICFIIALGAGLLGHSAAFSRAAVTFILHRFAPAPAAASGIHGTLAGTVTLDNGMLKNCRGLPVPNTVSWEKLTLRCTWCIPFSWRADVTQGKVVLPVSDPFIVNGGLASGYAALDFYGYKLALEDILSVAYPAARRYGITGTSEIQGTLSGPWDTLSLRGTVAMPALTVREMQVRDAAAQVDLAVRDRKKVNGVITIERGSILVRNTALNVERSDIIFTGDIHDPVLNLSASAVIDGVAITVYLGGTARAPAFSLVSDPPKNETLLLLMLLTGKSWAKADTALTEEAFAPDIAIDALDALFLGGRYTSLMKKLGIKDVSVLMNTKEKKIMLEENVLKKAAVGYSVEGDEGNNKEFVHGGYNVTDAITVEGQRQVKQEEGTAPEEKVLVTFKKSF